MERSSIFRLAGSAVLAAGVLLGPVGANAASHPSGHKASAPTWVSTKGKVVNLTLIAAYNNNGSGFNFNGASKGQLTVTVPLGDKVNVTFSNNASLPHSAQIVAFSKTPPTGSVRDAFKGASTANPTSGVVKGKTQKFSFTANKAGNYLIICAVPGHAAAGMWDTLVVSKTAHTASVSLKK
ncbi:MAG TPA: sulfocyanin-like copper-binding protein [Chloroflexota bacterium]|nr:sulfocyanin-like copper-binding protein [Chloroflexota bacterium]